MARLGLHSNHVIIDLDDDGSAWSPLHAGQIFDGATVFEVHEGGFDMPCDALSPEDQMKPCIRLLVVGSTGVKPWWPVAVRVPVQIDESQSAE